MGMYRCAGRSQKIAWGLKFRVVRGALKQVYYGPNGVSWIWMDWRFSEPTEKNHRQFGKTLFRPGYLCGKATPFSEHCMLDICLIAELTCERTSVEALERDILQVLVLWVVADPLESFLELDKLESCEVLRVTNQELARRLGSSNRRGIPQWWFCLHESLLLELKFSLEDIDDVLLCVFCWISAIW